MERRIELDILRGLFICLMVVDHTPNPLRDLTYQPVGFVSTAEGFVFTSAYLMGLISLDKMERHGPVWLRRFVLKRVCNLYLTHVMTLGFLFVTAGFLFQELPGFANFILHFLDAPGPAFLSSLLLLYQPPLFDILPMYIVFMAMTPLVIAAARTFGWSAVTTLSGLVWVSSFTGGIAGLPADAVAGNTGLVIEPGPFQLRAWQFIWVTGLALGQTRHSAVSRHFSPVVVAAACFMAVFFFCWRIPGIPVEPDLGDLVWMLDKWQLGPLRLLNFFALLILLIQFGPVLKKWLMLPLKPLSCLGRSALPVFSAHVCCTVLAAGYIETYQPGNWVCIGILGLQFVLLFGYSSMLGAVRRPLGASPAGAA